MPNSNTPNSNTPNSNMPNSNMPNNSPRNEQATTSSEATSPASTSSEATSSEATSSEPAHAGNDRRTTVWQLRELVRQFVDERDWQQFHNPKNLAMALTVEAGELMEHFQWLTTDQVVRGEGFDRAAVAEELADIAAYTLSLANAMDIDLASAMAAKMVKNRIKHPASGPNATSDENLSLDAKQAQSQPDQQ